MVGRAVDVARTTGSGLHVCNVHAAIGALALREGDWTEAARSLEESLRVAEQTGFHQSQDLAQLYLAELDIREERPEQAIKRLEPLVAEENAFPDLLPPLARAYLCIDDEKHIQQAAEIAERAVSQGRKQPGSLVDALLVRGMVLIRQRRDQEADRVLTEGLALARSQSFPYGEARILVQMGVLHLQRGEPEQAQARLEETLVIFQRLGARKDVEQVEEMIGRS